MKYCTNCGASLIENASFCNECGTRLVQSPDSERESTSSQETPALGKRVPMYNSRELKTIFTGFLDKSSNIRSIILLSSLILSIVGAIFIMTTGLGGQSVQAFGYSWGYDYWSGLGGMYSEASDNVFITLLAICLFSMALISVSVLVRKQATDNLLRLGRVLAIITIILSIVGEVVFMMVRAEIGYMDWWISPGFVLALLAGLVNAVLYTIEIKRQAKLEFDASESGASSNQ